MPGIYSRNHGLLHPSTTRRQHGLLLTTTTQQQQQQHHHGLSSSSSLKTSQYKRRLFGSKHSGRTSTTSTERSNDSSSSSTSSYYRTSNMSIPRSSRAQEFLLSPRNNIVSSDDCSCHGPSSTSPHEYSRTRTDSAGSSDDWGYFVDCDPVLHGEAIPLKVLPVDSTPALHEGMVLEL